MVSQGQTGAQSADGRPRSRRKVSLAAFAVSSSSSIFVAIARTSVLLAALAISVASPESFLNAETSVFWSAWYRGREVEHLQPLRHESRSHERWP